MELKEFILHFWNDALICKIFKAVAWFIIIFSSKGVFITPFIGDAFI